MKGWTPDLSLANHMFLGDVPFELRELTAIEEVMIACCHAQSWIIQLQEAGGVAPNVQRGVCGHIIVYPQEVHAYLLRSGCENMHDLL